MEYRTNRVILLFMAPPSLECGIVRRSWIACFAQARRELMQNGIP
jgi:hypothetical protein